MILTLVAYKAVVALVVFFVSTATIIYPLRKKRVFKHTDAIELSEALASGIFLGAAFFHMLPDAIKSFQTLYGTVQYPVPEIICVSGFLLLLFLERLSLANTSAHSHHSVPYILAIILIIHALTEGAVLGVGSTVVEALMLSIAIIAHKGSESFALCITMLRHQLPFRHILLIIIFFSLMTPLGIALGTTMSLLTTTASGVLTNALFNAFAAGTFLYISTLHHIRFHQHAQGGAQGIKEFTCLTFGLIAMGAIALVK